MGKPGGAGELTQEQRRFFGAAAESIETGLPAQREAIGFFSNLLGDEQQQLESIGPALRGARQQFDITRERTAGFTGGAAREAELRTGIAEAATVSGLLAQAPFAAAGALGGLAGQALGSGAQIGQVGSGIALTQIQARELEFQRIAGTAQDAAGIIAGKK